MAPTKHLIINISTSVSGLTSPPRRLRRKQVSRAKPRCQKVWMFHHKIMQNLLFVAEVHTQPKVRHVFQSLLSLSSFTATPGPGAPLTSTMPEFSPLSAGLLWSHSTTDSGCWVTKQHSNVYCSNLPATLNISRFPQHQSLSNDERSRGQLWPVGPDGGSALGRGERRTVRRRHAADNSDGPGMVWSCLVWSDLVLVSIAWD